MTTFNERSDRAAQALKQNLIGQGASIAPSVQVAVGPEGQQQPNNLPPEGSYARDIMERDRATAEAAQQLHQREMAMNPPVQAPATQQPQPPAPPAEEPLSANAQRRISELSEALRNREQELQQAREESRRNGESLAQLQSKVGEIETAYNGLVERNLDSLDPEERASVLARAQATQMVQSLRQELLSEIQPELQTIRQQRAAQELSALSQRYPRFDPDRHGQAIVTFRRQNPNCTLEQAFRAVAEPQDLMTQAAPTAHAVPPVMPPNTAGMPRYLPDQQQQQQQQRTPQDEIQEELAMAARLRSSGDPAEQLRGMRLIEQNIARRLKL